MHTGANFPALEATKPVVYNTDAMISHPQIAVAGNTPNALLFLSPSLASTSAA